MYMFDGQVICLMMRKQPYGKKLGIEGVAGWK